MACSNPQDDDQHNIQRNEPTLQDIDNVLALTRENVLIYLNNISEKCENLRINASERVNSYASMPGICVSPDETEKNNEELLNALTHIARAVSGVIHVLKLAEDHSRLALENFTPDDLQNIMNAGQQHILWRRVVLHRANVNLHEQQQLVPQPEQSLANQAATTALNLKMSIDCWKVERKRLTTHMADAIACLTRSSSFLAEVYKQALNVSDNLGSEVDSIITDVKEIIEFIKTFLRRLDDVIATLETVRKSAAEEG